jgi:hypothetical protein
LGFSSYGTRVAMGNAVAGASVVGRLNATTHRALRGYEWFYGVGNATYCRGTLHVPGNAGSTALKDDGRAIWHNGDRGRGARRADRSKHARVCVACRSLRRLRGRAPTKRQCEQRRALLQPTVAPQGAERRRKAPG